MHIRRAVALCGLGAALALSGCGTNDTTQHASSTPAAPRQVVLSHDDLVNAQNTWMTQHNREAVITCPPGDVTLTVGQSTSCHAVFPRVASNNSEHSAMVITTLVGWKADGSPDLHTMF